MLSSLVSYHIDPGGSVTAGASSCLNTFGLPLIFVVFVVTVDVKDVVSVAFCVTFASVVTKLLVSVVMSDALVAIFVLAVVMLVLAVAMLVVLVVTVLVRVVAFVAF